MAQRTRLPPQFSDTSKHIYHTVPDPNCLVGRAPARWKHEHTFRPATPDGASLGALHMGATLRRELERRRQATLRPGAFDYGGMSGSAGVAVVGAAAAGGGRAVAAQQEGEEWQPNQPRAAFPRLCRSSTRSARGQKQRQIQHQQQQQQEEEQLQLQQQHQQQQQQQQQQPPLMRAMTAVPGFRTPQRGDRSGRSNRSGRGDERPRTSGGGFGGVGDSSSRSRSSRSSRSSSSSSRAQRRPADPPIRLQHPPFNLDHSAGAVRRQMSWDVQVRERAHLASSQPGYIGAYRTYDANARRLMPQTPKGVGFDPRLDLAEDGRSDVTCWAR